MKKLNEFTVSLFTSGLVGAVVALPIIIISQSEIFTYTIKSALVGVLIGLMARSAYIFFYRRAPRYKLLSFASVFSIIAVGTGMGAWILGLVSFPYLIAIVIAAEIIGLTATILINRYACRLNERLKHTQDRIGKEES